MESSLYNLTRFWTKLDLPTSLTPTRRDVSKTFVPVDLRSSMILSQFKHKEEYIIVDFIPIVHRIYAICMMVMYAYIIFLSI